MLCALPRFEKTVRWVTSSSFSQDCDRIFL